MQSFLTPAQPEGEWIEIPRGYRTMRAWTPQIGDIFPNFKAYSTHGDFCFHNWAEGRWVYFYSHRSAFTPVCSTELASIALYQDDFKKAGIAIAAVSVGTLEETMSWVEEIEATFNVAVEFPVLSDPNGKLSHEMGLIHPKNDPKHSIRKSFIIDPALRLRMMFDYPACVGRSSEEVLRAAQALQIADRTELSVPADWQPGDDMLAPPGHDDDTYLNKHYGEHWTRVRSYLTVIQPEAAERDAEKRASTLPLKAFGPVS
jgi:peroxiredoxin (alkyl hydroperoxide reductase subunit C)